MISVLLVAGPTIWCAHFMVVYLFAEAVCAGGGPTQVLGVGMVSMLTLAATGVALAATLLLTRVAHRRRRQRSGPASNWLAGDNLDPGLALTGALLGFLFVIAILFVAMPAAVLDPC